MKHCSSHGNNIECLLFALFYFLFFIFINFFFIGIIFSVEGTGWTFNGGSENLEESSSESCHKGTSTTDNLYCVIEL